MEKLYQRYFVNQRSRLQPPEGALLFVPNHMWRTFNELLDAAGIPKQTPAGKLDFHALRTTYITHIMDFTANAKEAQTLARHQSLALTMARYAKTFDHRLGEAVERFAGSIFDTKHVESMSVQVIGERKVQSNQGVYPRDGGRVHSSPRTDGSNSSSTTRWFLIIP